MATLLTINIVLLAQQQINTSVYSQLWFVDNGIVDRGDFLPESMFLPVMVHLKTKPIELLVLPDRVQISLPSSGGMAFDDALARAQKFIDKASIGFKVVGVNVGYTFHDNGAPGRYMQRAKALFIGQNNPLYEEFNGQHATAGITLRKPVDENGHLQIDIRSGRAMHNGTPLYGNQEILTLNASQEYIVDSSEGVGQALQRIPSILDTITALVDRFEAGLPGGV
ncbi:hypothetical protein [Paraburkholderia phenoliruptrix]|uniref:hypothetical protein n=1 Tax=Paraburkholderia phenoliruptrix TaxID=252970 RepID=UPI003D967778